jgi:hypothetical protein
MAEIDSGPHRFAISKGVPDLFDSDGRPALSASTDAPVITDEAASAAPARSESRPAAASKPEVAPADTAAVDHDARIAEAERRLAALQQPLPAAPATTAPDLGSKPSRRDYDDPDVYETALVEWAAGNATHRTMAERDRQAGERAVAERQAEHGQVLWEAHQARRAKFIAAHPDYEEAVEKAPDLFHGGKPGTEALVQTIMRAKDGPAIAYYLAQNPAEEARITAMPTPAAVLVEVGKISARLEAGEPERRTRTAPASRPRAAAPAREPRQKAPQDMSITEYAQYRNEQLAKERRGGRMFG